MTNCHNISPSELGSQPFHEVSKDIDLRQTSPHIQKVWEKSSPWALGEMKKGLRSWPVAAEVGQFILDNAASDKRSIGEWVAIRAQIGGTSCDIQGANLSPKSMKRMHI